MGWEQRTYSWQNPRYVFNDLECGMTLIIERDDAGKWQYGYAIEGLGGTDSEEYNTIEEVKEACKEHFIQFLQQDIEKLKTLP